MSCGTNISTLSIQRQSCSKAMLVPCLFNLRDCPVIALVRFVPRPSRLFATFVPRSTERARMHRPVKRAEECCKKSSSHISNHCTCCRCPPPLHFPCTTSEMHILTQLSGTHTTQKAVPENQIVLSIQAILCINAHLPAHGHSRITGKLSHAPRRLSAGVLCHLYSLPARCTRPSTALLKRTPPHT